MVFESYGQLTDDFGLLEWPKSHGRQPEINLQFGAQSTKSHYFALKIVKSVVEHVTIEKRFVSKHKNFVFMS